MRRSVRIVFVLVAFAVMALSCSSERGHVIPRGRLSKIYADMLLMDEWISAHPSYNRMADTSFVYRPILRKYGYTEADYRRSVEKYIKDPDRYSRILQKTADVLDERQKHIQSLQDRLDSASVHSFVHTDFPDSLHYLAGMRNPSNFVDFGGITLYVDSIPGTRWRFDPASGFDTLFCGPRIIVVHRDTLSVADTLASVDTLAPTDSLAEPKISSRSDTVTILNAEHVVPIRNERLNTREISRQVIRDAQIQ